MDAINVDLSKDELGIILRSLLTYTSVNQAVDPEVAELTGKISKIIVDNDNL